ncbi:MerR family DNA-binding protein [Cupriavidus respiraculi]
MHFIRRACDLGYSLAEIGGLLGLRSAHRRGASPCAR